MVGLPERETRRDEVEIQPPFTDHGRSDWTTGSAESLPHAMRPELGSCRLLTHPHPTHEHTRT